jgi:putative ABC transport system permease protein
MSDFLTLVGLAALVIAGIGIGGGVSSYLEQRRASIATLKVLGATSSGDIVRIYAMQIGVAALAGQLAGLVAGVLVTPLLARRCKGCCRSESGFIIAPGAAAGGAFGLLVAWPLPRTRCCARATFPAMALMRSAWCRWAGLAGAGATGLGLAAICALALLTTAQPLLSGGFLIGAGWRMLGLLAGLGWGIQTLARRLPRPPIRCCAARWPISTAPERHRGAGDGAGLRPCRLRAARRVQTAIDGNIRARVPREAPDYFVLDVPRDKEPRFFELIQSAFPQGRDPHRADHARRGAGLRAEGQDDALPIWRNCPRAHGACAASAG